MMTEQARVDLAVRRAKAHWGLTGWACLSPRQRELEVMSNVLGIIASQAVDEMEPHQQLKVLHNIIQLAQLGVDWTGS